LLGAVGAAAGAEGEGCLTDSLGVAEGAVVLAAGAGVVVEEPLAEPAFGVEAGVGSVGCPLGEAGAADAGGSSGRADSGAAVSAARRRPLPFPVLRTSAGLAASAAASSRARSAREETRDRIAGVAFLKEKLTVNMD
jgi:hypothetical protein